MKNLKVKSILFSLLAVMAVAVFMTSCGKEQVTPNLVEQVVNETDNQIDERGNPFTQPYPTPNPDPCSPTFGTVLPHVQSKSRCDIYWGAIWSNGKCWWCH